MAELWRRWRGGGRLFLSGSIGTCRGEGAAGDGSAGDRSFYLVSSPPNITYLTGYDMIWYYLTSPVSVAVHADSGQTVFFEVPYHQPTVEWHAVVDDAEYFGDGQTPARVT